jgi:hypothetical protein
MDMLQDLRHQNDGMEQQMKAMRTQLRAMATQLGGAPIVAQANPPTPSTGVPSTRRAWSAAAASAASSEDPAAVFNQIDADGNGFVSVAELERWDGAPRPRRHWCTSAAAAPAALSLAAG